MEGDRFRLVGSHAKGLKSMSRGRGGSAAAWAARAASAKSVSSGRVMAGARAAAATMRAELRPGQRGRTPTATFTYFSPPYGPAASAATTAPIIRTRLLLSREIAALNIIFEKVYNAES